MPQNTDTLKFVEHVNFALKRGYIKNYSDLVKKLGWNLSVMSEVMNGKKNTPKHIISSFNTWYALQLRSDDTQRELELHRRTEEALAAAWEGYKSMDLMVRSMAMTLTELKQSIRRNEDSTEVFERADTELVSMVKHVNVYKKMINEYLQILEKSRVEAMVYEYAREEHIRNHLENHDESEDATKGDTPE